MPSCSLPENPGSWADPEFKELLPKRLGDNKSDLGPGGKLRTVTPAGAGPACWIVQAGVSFFCDGKSLDQVPALTHLAFLNGGSIVFIFRTAVMDAPRRLLEKENQKKWPRLLG